MTIRTAAQPPDDSQRHLEAYFFLVVAGLGWAGNAVLGKVAVGEISPLLLVGARWIGVLLLCILFLRRQIRRDWPLLKQKLPFLMCFGTLGFTCFNALFYFAAYTTSALNIGIMQGSIPVFVLLGTYAVFRHRIGGIQAIGVAMTVTGVAVVASRGSWTRLLGLDFRTGDLSMIFACCLYAGYTVALLKRPNASSLSVFAVMAASALTTALPLAGFELAMGDTVWPTPTGWLVIVLVTLFPSFLSQVLFIQGVDRIGPGRAGVFMNLVPVFAAFMAVLFLDEAFESYHAAALVMVLCGIALSEKFKPR